MSKSSGKPQVNRKGLQSVMRAMREVKGFQRFVKAGQGIQDYVTRNGLIWDELEEMAEEHWAVAAQKARRTHVASPPSRTSKPKLLPHRDLPPWALVIEIAASIAAGDRAYMRSLNEREALHWLDDYMAEVVTHHGREAAAAVLRFLFFGVEMILIRNEFLREREEEETASELREWRRWWRRKKRVYNGFQRLLDARKSIQNKDARVQAMVKEYRRMYPRMKAENNTRKTSRNGKSG